MMSVLRSVLLFLVLIALAHAGDGTTSGPAAPDADSVSGEQSLFGAPNLRFGRNASFSELPGYTFATASWLHQFDSGFDSLGGEVSSDDFSLWAPVAPLNFGNMHVLSLLGYRATQFDTSVPNMLSEDTLHTIRMPFVFLNDMSERWLSGVMIMPSFSGDLSGRDNVSISAAAGAGYVFSPALRIYGGVYYRHGFDEDLIIPGLMFSWRPDPQWEAYVYGPVGGISYSANDDWVLSLFGEYDAPTWHVEGDTFGPDRDITVSSMRIGLKAERRLGGLCWAYLAGGYSFARELEVEDLDSNLLQQDDIDPGPFVRIGLNLRY